MKRLSPLAFLLLVAPLAAAQDATLNTPTVRPSEAKYVVSALHIEQVGISVQVSLQDTNGQEVRSLSFLVPDSAHPGATVAGFMTALTTVRASETGGILRKCNFRVLGYLSDQGYLSGVTLNP